MTRRKVADPIGEIFPDMIYRVALSPAIFGYGAEMTRAKIRNGELPRPFPLSESARVWAWTGRQILDHRAKMQALAIEKVEAVHSRPPQPRPKAFAEFHAKRRKLKLKPPNKKVSKRETAGCSVIPKYPV